MNPAGDELPTVAALRAMSVFGADQAAAYREHFAAFASVLGEDVDTKLGSHVARWAGGRTPGVVILTGNAGTGKTAVAEAYCRAAGGALPDRDELVEVAPGCSVVKDLSGLPERDDRSRAVRAVLDGAADRQALVCANEGVLRDAVEDIGDADVTAVLEAALRRGAASGLPVAGADRLTVVNVNRQRPTAPRLWTQVLDYLTREEIWAGCQGCPFDSGGCPMRSNAEQLRQPGVREQLRTLVRLGAGEAVPTLREVLAILAWALVGRDSCTQVRREFRDRDKSASTAREAYFSRVLGGGLSAASAERSPLLAGIRRSGLGSVSDLQVDGWLRDASGAPTPVRRLAGEPGAAHPEEPAAPGKQTALAGTVSPLDRVRTKQGEMTFYALGEMISTDEDRIRVEDGLDALVRGDDSNPAAQALWRQRVYFEAAGELGGPAEAARRLLDYRHIRGLTRLAEKVASSADTLLERSDLVRGLNFLVTGFASPSQGLIVPDSSCLFARDPGSFRPALPALVHTQIPLDRLRLELPDRGLVEDLLDVDHVDVDLVVDADPELALRIRPRMYEAICEAGEFQGPVGQGVAEMNDLRGFYGRLTEKLDAGEDLRVADQEHPAGLLTVTLPTFAGGS